MPKTKAKRLGRLTQTSEKLNQLRHIAKTVPEVEDFKDALEAEINTYVLAFLEGGALRTVREIADATGIDSAEVYYCLLRLDTRHVISADQIRWHTFWHIEPKKLQAQVAEIIRQTPMTVVDLMRVTGASRKAVDAAKTQLKTHAGAVGLHPDGDKWGQAWYIPTEEEQISGKPRYRRQPSKSKSDVTPNPESPGAQPQRRKSKKAG